MPPTFTLQIDSLAQLSTLSLAIPQRSERPSERHGERARERWTSPHAASRHPAESCVADDDGDTDDAAAQLGIWLVRQMSTVQPRLPQCQHCIPAKYEYGSEDRFEHNGDMHELQRRVESPIRISSDITNVTRYMAVRASNITRMHGTASGIDSVQSASPPAKASPSGATLIETPVFTSRLALAMLLTPHTLADQNRRSPGDAGRYPTQQIHRRLGIRDNRERRLSRIASNPESIHRFHSGTAGYSYRE
jgi:hypothetical protein